MSIKLSGARYFGIGSVVMLGRQKTEAKHSIGYDPCRFVFPGERFDWFPENNVNKMLTK